MFYGIQKVENGVFPAPPPGLFAPDATCYVSLTLRDDGDGATITETFALELRTLELLTAKSFADNAAARTELDRIGAMPESVGDTPAMHIVYDKGREHIVHMRDGRVHHDSQWAERVIDADGSTADTWRRNGLRHREGAPAFERRTLNADGSLLDIEREWAFNGSRHNEHGPAYTWQTAEGKDIAPPSYCLHGFTIPAEHFAEQRPLNLMRPSGLAAATFGQRRPTAG